MRWLITGAGGMLATDVAEVVRRSGHDVVEVGRNEVDVTDPGACADAVAGVDVVLNGAAWTDVDGAEAHEAAAFAVNALGAANLAVAATRSGARLVHISTDYVFDGAAAAPYLETEPVRPVSAYGRTKAAGEWAVRAGGTDHLVVRTAWLYGAHGSSFPRTIGRLLRERGSVDVVTDQVGQPTWTADLARLVIRLVEAEVPGGTFHGTSSGLCSWHDLGVEVATHLGLDASAVRPTTSDAFVRPARRPAYSVLGHDALLAAGVVPIGDWRERWRVAAPSVLGR
ncbi:dTDP-4-dehydrorhamnose reductase [Cellulosimicrobium sp. MI9406]|jgi:dTDP-4-dehydrorhamnose reductase|uniref:dTDP-4-dehydrorhamnose reductase n=1 Tax=unclassified Cellulosimicrobium TaxID=2624466 RepID=UPI000A32A35C|nr:dTDP-4-dehydrorhamnose reductase [Cellulosimicrobium sp. KWT-B]